MPVFPPGARQGKYLCPGRLSGHFPDGVSEFREKKRAKPLPQRQESFLRAGAEVPGGTARRRLKPHLWRRGQKMEGIIHAAPYGDCSRRGIHSGNPEAQGKSAAFRKHGPSFRKPERRFRERNRVPAAL